MSVSTHDIAALLPAVLRVRDAALGEFSLGVLDADDRAEYIRLKSAIDKGVATKKDQDDWWQLREKGMAGPLVSAIALFAGQLAALAENIEQLYDDQFIETCAGWAVPYIGDLIGYRVLHGVAPKIASPRAEVAHTIGYRRRKGTVAVLEQLARDVTGWNATAVEFFQHLIVTQYLNHLRPFCAATPDLRQWEPLERIGSAFDTVMRTPDVRRIASGRGRFNIPNVGLFLWSLDAYTLSHSPAVAEDARRLRFHPLGIDQPLYTRPRPRDDFDGLSTPFDVPEPISRRVLNARLRDYYDSVNDQEPSLHLYELKAGDALPDAVDISRIHICNLSDSGATWAHLPTTNAQYAIDPVLGRIATPPDLPATTRVLVDFCYGFGADLGGGEYDRSADVIDDPPDDDAPPPVHLSVPGEFAHIQDALDKLQATGGVIEIGDSGRYEETLSISVPAKGKLVLRAVDRHRPTLVLKGDLTVSGAAESKVELHGLLIAGHPIVARNDGGNALEALTIAHCTLVPGLTLQPDAAPVSAGAASVVVGVGGVNVTLARSIVGRLDVDAQSLVCATDTIIDATAPERVAYAVGVDETAGAPLRLERCTVIGKVHARSLPLVSNTILLARDPEALWHAPVIAERLQEGCVRFSYVPPAARVPMRYRCLPEIAPSAALAVPNFTSLRYGTPGYGQLAASSGAWLLQGADDECQPGAFNFLSGMQRETNLRVRLAEYLRIGLEAGIFYEN
ncbi:hypothetical protein [Paraburkholderia rhizosphaerae]|uniref:Tail protein P2 I n=1 Tax=Paraburkholderia rhizosphaerae TaxID=480658 RepID=A0A4R8LUU2_9BURK|nr:hypothetical protein [Paraburkholderia rhizosphaerae]TDY50902.1 hypothetical protein BX592_108139 [Paraburkholderia rhizosphaerae]